MPDSPQGGPATTPHPRESYASREPLLSRSFLLACFVTLATFSSFYLLLATLPVYVVALGGTNAEVGLVVSLFSITTVVLRPFVGKAADDRGRRFFILSGSAVMALASGLYSWATTLPLLLGLRMLHGAGWASTGTAQSALVADIIPRTRRGEAMGYYGMFNGLAMAFGPALGITLMQGYSFTTLFLCSAAIAVVGLLVALFLPEPARHPTPANAQPPGGIIEQSAVFPSVVLALATITYGSIVSFLAVYATRQGIENPGLFFTVYAIVLIVARAFTGALSDRLGRGAVIIPGLLLAAVALWILAWATTLPAFLASAVVYGLGFACFQPALMALIVDRAAPSRRGAAMGTFSAAIDLGIGFGSLLWGFVAQAAGFELMYLSSGFVAILSALVFIFGSRRPAGRQSDWLSSR